MQDAARRAADRDRKAREDREPTIATRLGQIGVLGWAIVAPILLCVVIGRWLDATFKTGVFFTAPLIMLGAAAGLWTAWRWMHRQ
jgi:ATP synthase protein I